MHEASSAFNLMINDAVMTTFFSKSVNATFSSDCIGSAFNTKRAMECPNCRAIEAGQWNLHLRRPMPTQDRSGQVLEEMPEATSQMVNQRASNNRVLYLVPSYFLRNANRN